MAKYVYYTKFFPLYRRKLLEEGNKHFWYKGASFYNAARIHPLAFNLCIVCKFIVYVCVCFALGLPFLKLI